jgi:hypothetical protein
VTIEGVIYVAHDAQMKAHAGRQFLGLPTCSDPQSPRDCPLSRIWPNHGLYIRIHM